MSLSYVAFKGICPYFPQQLLQFRKDNAEVGFGSGTLALNQSIERTEANMKWISENKPNVLKWLEEETKATLSGSL